MELSTLVAQMIAITYISAGIAAFTSKSIFTKMIEDFEKSRGLTFITGFIAIILGMLLVTYHNIWVQDWPVLVTIIGWLSVVKGIMLIAFPQTISFFKKMYKQSQTLGALMIVFGLILGYFGFFA